MDLYSTVASPQILDIVRKDYTGLGPGRHILSSRLKHKAFFFLTHMYFQQFKEKKVVPSQEAVENMALMSVKKEPLEAWTLREFIGSETDNDLIMCARAFIFLLLGGHILSNMSSSLIHVPMRGNFWGCTIDMGALMPLQTWAWLRIPVLHPQLDQHVELDPRAPLDATSEEMITLIGRRSMLLMWRCDISGDSTLGIAFFYPLKIYHHPEMITLHGIGISRKCTSAIQHAVILRHSDTSRWGRQTDYGSGGRLGFDAICSSHPSGAGTSYIPPDLFDSLDADYVQSPSSTGCTSYAPPPPSVVGLSLDPPPPPGTEGLSVPHMPIFQASSSDSDDHGDDPLDDVTPA
ncbi:hypothetical protein M9H77_06353 [Catharanthus roseus]|uniref:Uncharacterized protein n=1 Tax=Catharanthus roseus TaxID=4058 RepID=A0ACC0BSA0_CATRO|nr:hypothetical protein M9H77_06353 [Catharanthus roseus]